MHNKEIRRSSSLHTSHKQIIWIEIKFAIENRISNQIEYTQSNDSKRLNWVWILFEPFFLFSNVNDAGWTSHKVVGRHSSFMIWHSSVRWYSKCEAWLCVEPFRLKIFEICIQKRVPQQLSTTHLIIIVKIISEPKSFCWQQYRMDL